MIVATAGTALACAGAVRVVPTLVSEAPSARVDHTVLLIGDAGRPDREFEPVLHALAEEIGVVPEHTTVVFLGDNVYPRGMPLPQQWSREESERRLMEQIQVVVSAGARAVFVPGNHDWAKGGDGGWDAVRRQDAFITEHGGGRAALLPAGGCPGPALVDVGEHGRLIALDTQWWLHGGPKPEVPDSTCGLHVAGDVTDSLRVLLTGAGTRRVIVVAHHPLETGGKHGGHFGWTDHVFPLREWKSWLWFPLPIIGSAYPLARKAGVSPQDLSSGAYQAMRDSLRAAFSADPPLVFAAGHEHNLQVLRGDVVPHLVVSGGGYYGHGDLVHWMDRTRFASSEAGFVRLDVLHDGRVRLGVIEVLADGSRREVFSTWLDETDSR